MVFSGAFKESNQVINNYYNLLLLNDIFVKGCLV